MNRDAASEAFRELESMLAELGDTPKNRVEALKMGEHYFSSQLASSCTYIILIATNRLRECKEFGIIFPSARNWSPSETHHSAEVQLSQLF